MSDEQVLLLAAFGALLARLGGSVELTQEELVDVMGGNVYLDINNDGVVLGLDRGNLQ